MRTTEALAKAEVEPEETAPSSKAAPSVEELKRLRQAQIEALARAASEDPAMVDRLVARVQTLATAIETLEKTRTKARNRRFTVCAFSGAVLLTGTLLLLHRPSTEILVDAKATQVGFRVAAPFAPLNGVADVVSVELAGLRIVRQEGSPDVTAATDEDLLLRVQPDTASKTPGSLGLDSLTIPVGTEIEMAQTGAGNQIEFRFEYPSGASPALDLDVAGDVVLRLNGKHPAHFSAPVRITAVPARDAQLIVEFRSQQTTFPAPIPVESIWWTREPLSLSLHPGGGAAESTILSGHLSLEEFKDRTVNLRNGELLHLGNAVGQIRQLRSERDGLSAQFDGAVTELATGTGGRRRNLMPTWLDWLHQRDALVQFWAVALYLAGLGMTVGRWWRESK